MRQFVFQVEDPDRSLLSDLRLAQESVVNLLDFYFVQPAKRRDQVIELNKKLQAMGKPELPVPTV